MSRVLAEIISIGDEMTSGARLDTNSQWLSQRLAELGITTGWHSTVADDLERQAAVFAIARDRAGLVVATGGLGPTADDLTRAVLARLSGQPLRRDPATVDHIRALFRRYGREMPESNLVQADFPDQSRIIPNPEGTAPGIDIDLPRADGSACRCFCLPGVPAEMQGMWEQHVRGAILASRQPAETIVQRVLHCFGAGESQVESMLPGMIARDRHPRIGITASQAVISLRIAATGPDPAECQRLVDADEATIRRCLGDLVFGVDDETLESVTIGALQSRKRTLSIADAGLDGAVFSQLSPGDPGRTTLRGGWVLRGGDSGSTPIPGYGSVSAWAGNEQLSLDIARRTASQFEADIGVAIGPAIIIDGTPHFPVAVTGSGTELHQLVRHSGHSALRQLRSVRQVINLVRLALNPG